MRVAARRWRIGSTKAAVLPVPVCAHASTSRPARTRGMTSRCTGVGCVYPSSSTARTSGGASPRAENGDASIALATSAVRGRTGAGARSSAARSRGLLLLVDWVDDWKRRRCWRGRNEFTYVSMLSRGRRLGVSPAAVSMSADSLAAAGEGRARRDRIGPASSRQAGAGDMRAPHEVSDAWVARRDALRKSRVSELSRALPWTRGF